ncbi:MAG: hypothetical protein ACREVC_09210, partial [Burkholderiales bacterium]
RLIEELETQAEALEGRSMSLTMRYLNFWLLHHIETTDKPHAKLLLERSNAAASTGSLPPPSAGAGATALALHATNPG